MIRRSWVPFGCVLGRLAAAALLVTWGAGHAAAQLTPQNLLEDAVSDASGPQYADVAEAITSFGNRDFDRAHKLLQKAKQDVPQLPPAEVVMARLSAVAQNPVAVRAWLERAVIDAPADPEAFIIFGEIAIQEGRVTDADALFARGLGLVTNFQGNAKRQRNMQMRSVQGLAAVAERRQKWAEARKYLEAWVKLAPDSAPAHQRLGQAMFYLDQPNDALTLMRKANELDKNAAAAEVLLGQLYEAQGKRPEAIAAMERAAQMHANNLGARLAIANWAINTNQLNLAVSNAEAAVKIDPASLQAKLARGIAARLIGDHENAERFFELAHLQSPGNFMASNNLALVLSEQPDEKKQTRGFEFAQMNVQRFPVQGNSQFRFEAASTLGWVLYQLGRPDEAAQALQLAASSGMLGPDARYYAARILHDRQRIDEAIQLLEGPVESDNYFVHRKKAEELLAQMKRKTTRP